MKRAETRLGPQRTGDALIAATAAAAFALTFRFNAPAMAGTEPGPAFVPRLLSVVLFTLAACAAAGMRGARERSIVFDKAIVLASLVLVAYAVCLPVVGYGVTTVSSIALVLVIVRAGSWRTIGAFSVGMTLTTYLIFGRALAVGLPRGPWGF
ncbi:MAG: hypothetical protein NVSMB64_27080 [Candidatus Velthaea sp.]